MLTDRSMEQTVNKLDRLASMLKDRLFVPVGQAQMLGLYETREPLHRIPDEANFGPVPESGRWGGDGVYGWFRMRYTVPAALDGKALFLWPKLGFYEATLWVNGCIHSNYAAKHVEGSHGNHWCNRITAAAKAGETFDFALEGYCWHKGPGSQPLVTNARKDFSYPVDQVDVCLRDEVILDFLFDLTTLLSLRRALPENSFRRAEVENALYEAHLRLFYDPDACTREQFYAGLAAAAPILKEQLSRKNGDSTPYVGLIGHSHMDTAWQWPIAETKKKCARTYANQLNLMEEYPEYRFVQSSAYHADILRRHYPELFERIRALVKAGRWEPNGGVWVECDCNLTGGEYLLRQFVWGQRFTRKQFGYSADSFWLPDTFGYSAAIPQIMKGCGIDYFLTTKIAWNDTSRFPATSFLWQGIDGTQVFTHFNRTHIGPTPETLHEITDGSDGLRECRVAPLRLFSFGKGDGGGGPEFEMLESARRLENLDGVPRSGYTTVSEFMQRLKKTAVHPSVWADELYLELHRGTLTNQHEIKHNNRRAENALHSLELATVMKAVREGEVADGKAINPLTNTLLINQFHDILPGTCIHRVHAECREAVSGVIRDAEAMTCSALSGGDVTLFNPLSMARTDTIYLPGDHADVNGCRTQVFSDLNDQTFTAVSGLTLPPFSAVKLPCGTPAAADDPFLYDRQRLTTPFAEITFDDQGAMASFIDRRSGRELVGGLPFNTFLMTEDVPAAWDNWDIDADEEEKFAPAGTLLSREIISRGAVEMRIRSRYALTDRTELVQDMVFSADSPLITFDTVVDWQEEHRFLKAAFDTALMADGVRSEIQFGYLRRSNHRATMQDKARFEICNHKYSDLSEENYGIALLNDCKYGLSVNEGSMRLSLHKGGMRPDDQGDKGRHAFRYALLPHDAAFSAQTVVQPAYAFNQHPLLLHGGVEVAPLVQVDNPNVIIETVKPCEDAQHAYILRLYEAAGGYARANLTFSHAVKAVYECNMLEEEQTALDIASPLAFTPFRIRTLKVCY